MMTRSIPCFASQLQDDCLLCVSQDNCYFGYTFPSFQAICSPNRKFFSFTWINPVEPKNLGECENWSVIPAAKYGK